MNPNIANARKLKNAWQCNRGQFSCWCLTAKKKQNIKPAKTQTSKRYFSSAQHPKMYHKTIILDLLSLRTLVLYMGFPTPGTITSNMTNNMYTNTGYKQSLVTFSHSYLTQEFCPKNNVPTQFVFLDFHRSSLCHNSVESDMLVKMSVDPLKRKDSDQHDLQVRMTMVSHWLQLACK